MHDREEDAVPHTNTHCMTICLWYLLWAVGLFDGEKK